MRSARELGKEEMLPRSESRLRGLAAQTGLKLRPVACSHGTGVSQLKRSCLFSADDGEKLLMNGLRDGTHPSVANANLVHGADGRDLGRCSGEERLVRDVQHLARHALLRPTGIPSSRAICRTESRVIPGSTELPSGAVCRTPLRTTNTFSPEPSLT